MTNSPPMLRLAGITKSYPSVSDVPPLAILSGIDLALGRGEAAAVIGPSGCGKSTLLNIIGTLDHPDSGELWLEDQNLARQTEDQLAGLRCRSIGFIFQSHHLLPHCTVLENVLVPTLALAGRDRDDGAPERARRLLDRAGLASRLDHRPGQLSGGEQQRVAVVRALINQPKLVLGDEPTGALDRRSADQLAELLVELNREEGVTLILVTHAPDLAARMKRRFELREGRLFELA